MPEVIFLWKISKIKKIKKCHFIMIKVIESVQIKIKKCHFIMIKVKESVPIVYNINHDIE